MMMMTMIMMMNLVNYMIHCNLLHLPKCLKHLSPGNDKVDGDNDDSDNDNNNVNFNQCNENQSDLVNPI